jgi:hypothetical protein
MMSPIEHVRVGARPHPVSGLAHGNDKQHPASGLYGNTHREALNKSILDFSAPAIG